MATPRRRSSRISVVPTPSRLPTTPSMNKLSSLIERDESPESDTMNIDSLVSLPNTPNTAPNPARFGTMSAVIKTPHTVSRMAPPRTEMHPSKAQKSTKEPEPVAGSLISHPVSTLARSPSKIAILAASNKTQPKRHSIASQPLTSPTFDFKFDKPKSDLSSEAKKIMDNVREEAARIKAQVLEDSNKQMEADKGANDMGGIGGRKIRKPRGKSGRFSAVHRAEFKKMDSIADHASTWKAKLQGAAPSPLKRNLSRKGLGETPQSLPRTKPLKSLYDRSSERLENPSPVKRAKRFDGEDVSKARPTSKDSYMELKSTTMTPTKPPALDLASAVTTPINSSMARSASVKSLKTTMIPTLTKSPSTKLLRPPQTEGSNNKRLTSWSRIGGNMKSMLHRAQPKFSSDVSKVAAGTHLPLPRKPDTDKALPSLPGTPSIKQVNFALGTKSSHQAALAAASPTPSRILSVQQGKDPASSSPTMPITYPDLTASPNITVSRAKSPKSAIPGPSNFTFRANADSAIAFGSPRNTTVTSPTAARTIRPVRPSGAANATSMPGAFNFSPEPSISHGINNKKRKNTFSDDEDGENVDPKAEAAPAEEGRAAKKARIAAAPTVTPVKQGSSSPTKRRLSAGGAGATLGKKKGISLGRLNMLARPKQR